MGGGRFQMWKQSKKLAHPRCVWEWKIRISYAWTQMRTTKAAMMTIKQTL